MGWAREEGMGWAQEEGMGFLTVVNAAAMSKNVQVPV